MKIVGFTTDAGLRLGVVEGDQVVDLQAVDPKLPSDLGAVLKQYNGDLKPLADLAKRAPASAKRPLAGLSYALPVAHPGKIICLGLNYLEHVKEGPNAANIPKFPTLFMRGLNSVVPHQHALTRPLVTETFDYEAEMVVVIGKRAKHMTLENAYSCIAGYTCANEGSIREFQRHTTQWHMARGSRSKAG
jgi:2-keto-4-pentenoate hydratase/2-oxohepta-3-ene-1,7-dioic acid hydratase in catechol pathway